MNGRRLFWQRRRRLEVRGGKERRSHWWSEEHNRDLNRFITKAVSGYWHGDGKPPCSAVSKDEITPCPAVLFLSPGLFWSRKQLWQCSHRSEGKWLVKLGSLLCKCCGLSLSFRGDLFWKGHILTGPQGGVIYEWCSQIMLTRGAANKSSLDLWVLRQCVAEGPMSLILSCCFPLASSPTHQLFLFLPSAIPPCFFPSSHSLLSRDKYTRHFILL